MDAIAFAVAEVSEFKAAKEGSCHKQQDTPANRQLRQTYG
jgi:hypothetical protein